MTFLELIEAIEEYASIEHQDPLDIINQLTEHYIPGIEDIPDIDFPTPGIQ